MNYNHNIKQLPIATQRRHETIDQLIFSEKTKLFWNWKTTIRETVRSNEDSSVVFLDLKRKQIRLSLTATQNLLPIFVPFILSWKRLHVTSSVRQESGCHLPLNVPSLQGSRNTSLQRIQLSVLYHKLSLSGTGPNWHCMSERPCEEMRSTHFLLLGK